MNIATLVFIIIVAGFMWRGYTKGFIGAITRILSWLIAYPAAIFFTRPVAKLLIQYTPLDGMVVYFVAGSAIFLSVAFAVSLLLAGIAKLIPKSDTTETSSKIGGAGVGMLMGSVAGLLAVYIITLLPTANNAPSTIIATSDIETSRQQTAPSTTDSTITVPKIHELESAKDSFIEASAKKLIGSAAATAVNVALNDSTATQVTKAFIENPQTMLTHVQHVSNDGKIKELLADEKIQSMLSTGDVNALMKEQGFTELMADEHMQALIATADNKAIGTNGQQVAAEKMVAAWQRANDLKNDPRIIAILSDPEFQKQLNSPNKLALMMNPKLNQLTEIIFSDGPATQNHSNNIHQSNTAISATSPTATTSPTQTTTPEEKPPTKIYRWTDENGKVHYSDKEKQ